MERFALRRPRAGLEPARGFTLIELLVVLVVIGLLMAILLPVLSRARAHGRQSACLAQLHSLGQALAMYADDHDGRLPNANPTGTVLDPAATDAVLVAYAQHYVKAPMAFHCPSDEGQPAPERIDNGGERMPNSARLSYDYYSIYWFVEMGPRIDLIRDAPLVWDYNGGGPAHGHNGGGNVAFADGHAAWQKGADWDGSNWPFPADLRYQ